MWTLLRVSIFSKSFDLRVPLPPDGRGHKFVDSRDENVFVLRPIENSDGAFGRDGGMHPPQEIMVGFERAGLLEGCYGAALRVDAGHHMLDGSIFARGIHSLQDNQKGAVMLRIQQRIVQGRKLFHVRRMRLRGVASLKFHEYRSGRRELAQP